MNHDKKPLTAADLIAQSTASAASLHAKYAAHEATLDRLERGIDRILAGNEPRADAQLEVAVFGFGPQEGDPSHYSTPCSAAELATLERQAKPDPNVCLLCGWSTTWLDTDNGEVGRYHRKIEMRVCTNPECEEAE